MRESDKDQLEENLKQQIAKLEEKNRIEKEIERARTARKERLLELQAKAYELRSSQSIHPWRMTGWTIATLVICFCYFNFFFSIGKESDRWLGFQVSFTVLSVFYIALRIFIFFSPIDKEVNQYPEAVKVLLPLIVLEGLRPLHAIYAISFIFVYPIGFGCVMALIGRLIKAL